MFSWVEIKKFAIRNNLKEFRRIIGPRVKLMAVVKSNAYGHGMVEVAKIAIRSGANWLGVANLDEALQLRQVGIKAPIFILSYWDMPLRITNLVQIYELRIKKAIKENINFPIYTVNQGQILSQIARKIKKPVNIHLKIDTGTSRIGILPNQTVDFLKEISKMPYLNLAGVFTHYASSESYDQTYTNWQTEKFKKVLEIVRRLGFKNFLAHAGCTASTIVNSATHFDLVRIGIGLYGLWPSVETKKLAEDQGRKIILKPALTWKTKIIQIKELPPATFVGYDRTFKTARKTKIAVLPIGYWDGYDRRLSNPTPLKLRGTGQGEVLIKGKRCPIRGRVCMNLTMVEITNISNVKVGDEVVLIGKQGQEEITIDEIAEKIGTINYEVATRVNALILRKYV